MAISMPGLQLLLQGLARFPDNVVLMSDVSGIQLHDKGRPDEAARWASRIVAQDNQSLIGSNAMAWELEPFFAYGHAGDQDYTLRSNYGTLSDKQEAGSDDYVLGTGMIELAAQKLSSLDGARVAQPILAELSDELGLLFSVKRHEDLPIWSRSISRTNPTSTRSRAHPFRALWPGISRGREERWAAGKGAALRPRSRGQGARPPSPGRTGAREGDTEATLRLAVGNVRTEERHVRRAYELLRYAAQRVA